MIDFKSKLLAKIINPQKIAEYLILFLNNKIGKDTIVIYPGIIYAVSDNAEIVGQYTYDEICGLVVSYVSTTAGFHVPGIDLKINTVFQALGAYLREENRRVLIGLGGSDGGAQQWTIIEQDVQTGAVITSRALRAFVEEKVERYMPGAQ